MSPTIKCIGNFCGTETPTLEFEPGCYGVIYSVHSPCLFAISLKLKKKVTKQYMENGDLVHYLRESE